MRIQPREMEELNVPVSTDRLFDQIINVSELRARFVEVKRNKGAAGVDGVSLKAFESNLEEELAAVLLMTATFLLVVEKRANV